jgi:hypothetical protein
VPLESELGLEDRVLQATIEAELATGAREETVAEARLRVAVRLLRMGAGSAILAVGAVMLVLPGPGWLMIALGLGILARDVAWAERAVERVRRRMPTDSSGGLSRATIATMIVLALATIAGSVWWFSR